MRIALLAAALALAPNLAQAAFIEGDDAFACYDLAYQKRVDSYAGAGDQAAAVKAINDGLASSACAALPAGLRVRIEDNSFPYACVAKFGTTGRCLWVRQRNVNPRN